MDERAPGADPAARLENEALDAQVKLLVQAEQRLYRSQNELGRQLQNMRELGLFALSCSGADDLDAILGRALRVMGAAFTLDWIAAIAIDPPHARCRLVAMEPPRAAVPLAPLEPPDLAWLAARPALELFHLPASGPPGRIDAIVSACWPAEIAAPAARPGRMLLMTLRGGSSQPRALLLAYSADKRRAMYWPADLSERNQPFLELFANHLERALENSGLTAELRERTQALTASLAALERTQATLVQSQKMEAIGRLAGGIAHDFNNILTVILGYTALIRDAMPPDAPRRRDVERVIVAGERAAGITRQLLAFGRRQVQRREAVDLNRLSRAMVEMLERLIGEQVRLVLDLCEGAPPVWVDPAHLEQVLMNLVVNARDALPEGGEVHVCTRAATGADAVRCGTAVAPEAFVVLEVSDDGIGMDEATRAHLFEPFFSTKEIGRGSGLGLAVVYGIVQQNEGHVLVDSAPGRGSRFTVLLPRSPEPVALPAPPAAPAAPAAPASGTILIVEDELIIRLIAREILEPAGYRVEEAADGAAALEWLVSSGAPVDLVLSDVVMPRLGGVKMAEELRRVRPGLPVLFISGYSHEHAAAAVAPVDGIPVVMKPFTRDQLLAAVAERLAAARAR